MYNHRGQLFELQTLQSQISGENGIVITGAVIVEVLDVPKEVGS